MKAHYNANNEIMYGVWMMDNAWLYENEMMQDEIYSEQGLTAEDAALAKFFFKKWDGEPIYHVDVDWFSKLLWQYSIPDFQAFDVPIPVEAVKAMLEALQDMKPWAHQKNIWLWWTKYWSVYVSFFN